MNGIAGYNRRLPIYLLLDCSESMVGEPLDHLNQGLSQLCIDLKTHPQAIETAWVSVIAFSDAARQLCTLTEVLSFQAPTLQVGPGTSFGGAIDLLGQCISREVRLGSATQKGDWKPLVFLLTDGQPTDDWRAALARFKADTNRRVADVIALGCGQDVDGAVLREFASTVLLMKNISPGQMQRFFKMVSASVVSASASPSDSSQRLRVGERLAEAFEVAGAGSAAAGPPSQIILAARCSDSGKGYLMRYRRADDVKESYRAENGYPVPDEYFAAAAGKPAGQMVDSSKLQGSPACPHCGRKGWKVAERAPGIACADSFAPSRSAAQVMFVLDVTGSMHGEIDGVKNSIQRFMDYIQSEGLSVEVGLIAFRDLECDEPPELLRFGGRPFTADAAAFKSKVGALEADGGGSNPGESSFDALVLACRQPFDESKAKILVLITDEPPLLPDGPVRSIQDVSKALSAAGVDQLHLVVSRDVRDRYTALHGFVKGSTFPLSDGKRGGLGFEKVLLDVGRSITVATRLG